MKIKVGDLVEVMAGPSKGTTGIVTYIEVDYDEARSVIAAEYAYINDDVMFGFEEKELKVIGPIIQDVHREYIKNDIEAIAMVQEQLEAEKYGSEGARFFIGLASAFAMTVTILGVIGLIIYAIIVIF